MVKRVILILMCIGIMSGVVACSQGDLNTPPQLLVPNAAFDSNYWRLDCQQQDNGVSYRVVMHFFNGNYTIERVDSNSSKACDMVKSTFLQTGTYTIAGTSGTSVKINMTVNSWIYTPLTADMAKTNSDDSYCGITDWKAGESQSILGQTCMDQTLPQQGDTIYQIYDIATVPDGIRAVGDLFMGAVTTSYDSTTDATRPHSLNSKYIYRHYR